MCFFGQALTHGLFDLFSSLESGEDQPAAPAKIVAVDLQAMAPLEGVIQLQGDITKVGL